MTDPTGEVLVYADPEGLARVRVRLEGGSLWLSQRQLSELFGTSIQNVSQHLRAIYAEAEVSAPATIKKYLIVQTEGGRSVSRSVEHYSLPEPVDADFDAAIANAKVLEQNRPRRPKGRRP